MSLNSRPLNTTPINGFGTFDPDNLGTGSGKILSIKQKVFKSASGKLISISQRVVPFYQGGEGSILSISQEVTAHGSGKLFSISQVVHAVNGPSGGSPVDTPNNFYIRNNYYPVIVIGAYAVPESMISDVITTSSYENTASQLNFTLLLRKDTPIGLVNFEWLHGQPVSVDVYKDGSYQRIFTGQINTPMIDLMRGSIECNCTNNRRDTILSSNPAMYSLLGYYDEDIMGKATDLEDEVSKRLSTSINTVDLDRFGNIVIGNLLPAVSPHWEFGDSVVYRDKGRDPKIKPVVKSTIVNQYTINVRYQYARLYHANITCSWDWDVTLCQFLLDGYTLPLRATIEAAINGSGWILNATPGISYTPPPNNGTYTCSGISIQYSTVQHSGGTVETLKDADGNEVTGSDGKPISKLTGVTETDYRNNIAIGASWRMSKRFSQNMEESYSLTLSSPQSISQFGVVSETEELNVEDNLDASDWENYKGYSALSSAFQPVGSGASVYYYDRRQKLDKLNKAFLIGVRKAESAILKSHRDYLVTFTIKLTPSIDIFHTVYLNTDRLQAYGKVISVDHYINITDGGECNTKVTIALCRSIGSASSSGFIAPTPSTYLPATKSFHLNMSSIYGEEPLDRFSGWVGNRWKTEADFTFGFRGSNTFKTTVQERFILKTPEVGQEFRKAVTLAAAGTYTVVIPNHLLEAYFL